MGVATFSQSAIGVLASYLISEFDLERWQVGILLTANGVTGALLSPVFGRLTDRKGSVKSVVWVLSLAMVTMTLVATAPTYAVLFVAGCSMASPMVGSTRPPTP
jgi:FSR family fosmidomycin resistance protein-like MFS transporter